MIKEPVFGTAIYKCEGCGYVWGQPPGPVGTKEQPGCPKCQHLYMKWLNFDQWQKEYEVIKIAGGWEGSSDLPHKQVT